MFEVLFKGVISMTNRYLNVKAISKHWWTSQERFRWELGMASQNALSATCSSAALPFTQGNGF